MSMRKIMDWSQAHPCAIILFLLVGSILSISQLKNLHIDTSSHLMMVQNDPAKLYYNETLKRFGSDCITIVYVRDPNLFTPHKLKVLDDLAFRLEGVKGVRRVESLYSVMDIKNQDGVLYAGPLMDAPPETVEQARKIRADAMANTLIRRNLISDDGMSTAINLYLKPMSEDPDFMKEVRKGIEAELQPYRPEFVELFQMGTPYNVQNQADTLTADQIRLGPLVFGLFLIILLMVIRSTSGVILTVVTGGFSILWTLGFMGALGLPFTMLSFMVPSMIMVIGSTEDIHLVSEFLDGMKLKGNRSAAVQYMSAQMGTAVFITAATTCLGFFSTGVNQTLVLRQFGIVSGFGLLINPIITILVAPVYLRYLGPKQRIELRQPIVDRMLASIADALVHVVRKHRNATLCLLVGGAAAMGLCAVNLKIDTDRMHFFKSNSEFMRRINILQDTMCGSANFCIRIDGAPGDFRKPENLKRVEALLDYANERKWFDQTVTLNNFLKLVHREINGGKPEFFRIPDSTNTIAEYLVILRRDEIGSYVTPEFDSLNILVRHRISSSRELAGVFRAIKARGAEILSPDLRMDVTGEAVLVNRAVDNIALGQALSIGLNIAVFFIAMSVLFVSLKAGILALIPNIMPLAVGFGIMALFDIPLNTATCMVAPIVIGIAVDDTIHMMIRYRSALSEKQSPEEAMETCIRAELRPMLATSFALSVGFGVLGFSHFIPVQQFGILSFVVLAVGTITELLVTPSLLVFFQLTPYKKRARSRMLPKPLRPS